MYMVVLVSRTGGLLVTTAKVESDLYRRNSSSYISQGRIYQYLTAKVFVLYLS
jgi:hypothetical protein